MMIRPACAVFALAFLLGPGQGLADEVRPSTYDECILETLKGVSSDVAANAIIESCRNQFPAQVEVAPVQEEVVAEPEPVETEQAVVAAGTSRNLTAEELDKLDATAFIVLDSYRITFRNNNEHLTVTEVTIAVEDKSGPDGLRTYSERVQIAPLTSGTAKYKVSVESNGFELDTISVSEPNWHIAAAQGTGSN
jgi:hypothetical protein